MQTQKKIILYRKFLTYNFFTRILNDERNQSIITVIFILIQNFILAYALICSQQIMDL